MAEKFLKTGEVAKIFNVTLRTIKNWRQSGKLKPVSINEKGHFLYSESQIEDFKLLLASGKSESVQPDKTSAFSVPVKTISPNTPKPNESKKAQANKKNHSVAKEPCIKDEEKYGNLLQGKPTNALATTSSKKIVPNLLDNAEITTSGIQILIKEFSKIKLNVPTLKVLDTCILKLTKSFPHGKKITDEDLLKHKDIKVTADEYMTMTGIKDKKQAYQQLKDAMNTLYNISFEWSEKTFVKGKEKDVRYAMRLAEAKKEELTRSFLHDEEFDGSITLSLSMKMAHYFATAYVMPYPYDLLTINSHKNPHSYFIGRKLALHHNMNIDKKNSNRISVKSLIGAIPDLPKYENFQKGSEHVTQRMIIPFERDLIALKEVYGILKDWHYCNSGGEAITDEQVEKYDYATWIEWLVEFEFADYPDQSERITKMKLRKQRTLTQSKNRKNNVFNPN